MASLRSACWGPVLRAPSLRVACVTHLNIPPSPPAGHMTFPMTFPMTFLVSPLHISFGWVLTPVSNHHNPVSGVPASTGLEWIRTLESKTVYWSRVVSVPQHPAWEHSLPTDEMNAWSGLPRSQRPISQGHGSLLTPGDRSAEKQSLQSQGPPCSWVKERQGLGGPGFVASG